MTRKMFGGWMIGLVLVFPAAAMAEEAYTTTAVNLRAGPDADYPLVRWVPEGTAVEVHGCLSDYRWCDIEVFGDRGWMSASYLVYPYQSSQVPILSYGAVIGLPILGFSIDSYWDDHYRRRPWYDERPRWEHRRRPEFYPPQRRQSEYYPGNRPPPQYYPPGNRPQYNPPGNSPPQFYPPGNNPQYNRQPQVRPPQVGDNRPPDIRPGTRPDYRPPDVRPTPRPDYRPPDVRPPSGRPGQQPGQQPGMRAPQPEAPRQTPGRDPRGLRDNSGERGGMNTGNF